MLFVRLGFGGDLGGIMCTSGLSGVNVTLDLLDDEDLTLELDLRLTDDSVFFSGLSR